MRRGGRTPIRFRTYNIRNGWNGGLDAALRVMGQANVDVGVFQDKKLTDRIYTWGLARYRVNTIPAPSWHRSGITFFYRDSPAFAVEAIRQFGANVIA